MPFNNGTGVRHGLLVTTVMLTSLGYLYRFYNFSNRSFSQIYFEWGISEAFANGVVMAMEVALVLAFFCAPFKKLRLLLLPALISLVFETLGHSLDMAATLPWLAWPENSLRLVPFAILIFLPSKRVSLHILKFAAAATFIAHGIKALGGYPEFADYLVVFFQLAHAPITDSFAVTLLHGIGTIDILLGHHLLFFNQRRVQWVVRYMIIWGTVTAFARVMYGGWGSWPDVAIRSAHGLMMLLILLWGRDLANQDASIKLKPS